MLANQCFSLFFSPWWMTPNMTHSSADNYLFTTTKSYSLILNYHQVIFAYFYITNVTLIKPNLSTVQPLPSTMTMTNNCLIVATASLMLLIISNNI